MQHWEERIFLNQQLGVRVYTRIINFATSKNLVVKSTTFTH